MKAILKFKWLIVAIWLAAAVGLFLSAPNMQELVREKGQITVPDGYSSTEAAELLRQLGEEEGGSSGELSSVLVFHNPDGLTAAERAEAERGIRLLQDGRETYGVTAVTTHFDMPELEDQMVAEDGTTILALVSTVQDGREPAEVGEALYAALDGVQVEHYYTGNWLINEDVIKSSEEGLKKTEFITLIFILAILFVVFRSAVAPFIPLLAVGLSYVLSQSVVAYLVEYLDFPLSNFTQIFMVAVMFGIGTDYCILLISRFKEELAHSGDKTEAILATYRTAGKTVLVSGLAVLVGFSAIGFSTFVLYQSAVAVAVGVAVLLLALLTIVPFFMAVLGKAIFWPTRGSLEHKPSRLWGAVGGFSLRRPVWALLILAVIIVPLLIGYRGSISFNSLDEIGDKYDSVKAFNAISDSFGPGESLPATVVVRSGEPLDTPAGLAVIEQISRELAGVDGVKTVRSATRPTGEALDQLQVAEQAGTLGSGLGEGEDGLVQIKDGLADASAALGDNAPQLQEAVGGADALIDGTQQLKGGVAELTDGLTRIEQGLRDGTAGAAELQQGLEQAAGSAQELADASEGLLAGYRELEGGLDALRAGYGEIASGLKGLGQGLDGLDGGLAALGASYPELQQDETYVRLRETSAALAEQSAALAAGLSELNTQLGGVSAGLGEANSGLAQASEGQTALTAGLRQLAAGLGELRGGIAQAADGQGQIVGRLPELSSGIDGLLEGQTALQSGIAQMSGQLSELTDGLDASVDGLTQVAGGLQDAQAYLGELAEAPNRQVSGWFVPEEAIASEDFQSGLDVYLSADRDIAKFEVVFAGNPYATETLEKVDDLEAATARALQGTAYADATYAIDGVSSMNNDLRNISAADYARTVLLMLIGIGLILIVMFRSIVMPLYLVASLLVTYYTSMALAEVLFVRILGYSGISWAVPFFGFVMLVALGIDYSIFLMDRFKEYRHLPPRDAILLAMKHMGTVIMSAAVILGGTFAAMLPSGVMSLLQIATVVLCGLFLYALLMLPLFIPVMVRTFGEANWWPFMRGGEEEGRYRTGSLQARASISSAERHDG
ncbi:MMPL family transporter [Paenibacillus sp. IB182496]|uniref:MMPL family transporter n=1 Tax=Paenibacillus sabuli TaxID=2772509 RepID=A0A927GTQ2_9BACL|nr:MMPL family transporter [Paenibacillus sabuli]MBD2846932.1 MMPL family transporter [Paenibacillus sabuli]